MARKKKKKGWFGFGSKPKKRRTQKQIRETRQRRVAAAKRLGAVFAAVIVVFGVSAGFVYLNRYVQAVTPTATNPCKLELVSPPEWVGGRLDESIIEAIGDYEFLPHAEAAETVARRLQNFAWLYNVRVQRTSDTIRIFADYRKPVAMVSSGRTKYYVSIVKSDDLLYEENQKKVVVLDYVAMDNLPIVEVRGLGGKIPPVGTSWTAEDITTTAELVNVLVRMDEISCPSKPLVREIKCIDVFNFDGRKNRKDSHIIIYAKDGTEIRWGAAYGKSRLFVESTEEEKLGDLYTFYTEHDHTVQCIKNNICQSVDLRFPKKIYPRPGI